MDGLGLWLMQMKCRIGMDSPIPPLDANFAQKFSTNLEDCILLKIKNILKKKKINTHHSCTENCPHVQRNESTSSKLLSKVLQEPAIKLGILK